VDYELPARMHTAGSAGRGEVRYITSNIRCALRNSHGTFSSSSTSTICLSL
jgi:hypothetical protein